MTVMAVDGFADDLPLRQVELLGDFGALIDRRLRHADRELRVLRRPFAAQARWWPASLPPYLSRAHAASLRSDRSC